MDSEDSKLTNDLRQMIERQQVAVVIGSGVSLATNSNSPTWRQLLESAVEHCRSIGSLALWCDLIKAQLEMTESPDMLLSAAELVHSKLAENGGGELARWLSETFQPLEAKNPSIIQTLAALELPLLTTN